MELRPDHNPQDPETRLLDARRRRAYARMQLTVLRRLRSRAAEDGRATEDVDARIAGAEAGLAEHDREVEALRRDAGRRHRPIS
jgi:hypothetical protein